MKNKEGAGVFRNMSSVSLTEVSPAPLTEVTAQMVLSDHKRILGAEVKNAIIHGLHVPLEAVNLLWVVVDEQGRETGEYGLVAAYRSNDGSNDVGGKTEIGFLGGKVPRLAENKQWMDYNPDGREEVAVFRPTEGMWYIQGLPDTMWGGVGRSGLPIPRSTISSPPLRRSIFRLFT